MNKLAFMMCYITDRHTLEPKPLLPRILAAVKAGIELVQIREKDLETRDLAQLVKGAVDGARGTDSRVVVNDRLDVALALGAAGVHLGIQSMPALAVRACVSRQFVVGASCHSLSEALQAEAAGADYVLLGPIFSTPTKIGYGPPLGLETVTQVAAQVRIPLLALGGISVARARACRDAGATGIAGISIFQDCDSLEDRVRQLRNELGRR